MGYCRQIELPTQEPVSLDAIKGFLRLPPGFTADDALLTSFIQGAREQGEILTGRTLAQRKFTQVLDSHPYYTDAVQSQAAYPPSYYSLPRYSTTLWNYSQMIKLGASPAVSVERMRYIAADGAAVDLHQDTDFILDRITEPARIFPKPGTYWPADLYVANSVQIDFTAGYDADGSAVSTHAVSSPPSDHPGQQPDSTIVTGVPQMIVAGILNLVTFWWTNRGAFGQVPTEIIRIFQSHAIVDWAPTRG